jgi:predicted RecA/RadA family phage recombinase
MGVAGCSGASGDPMPLHTEGVFSLPKTTSEAWSIGQALYWNTGTSKFTTDASKLPVGARAAAAAGSSATTGAVLLGDPPLHVIAGQATTASASDTIVTGFALLTSVVATMDDSPRR